MYSNYSMYQSAGDEQHQQQTTHDYVSGVPAQSGVDDLTNIGPWDPLHESITLSSNDPHLYAAHRHVNPMEHNHNLSPPPSSVSTFSGSYPASDHPAIADAYSLPPIDSPGFITSQYASPELSQIGSLAESIDLPAPGYYNVTAMEMESFGLSAMTTQSTFMPPRFGGYPDCLVPSSLPNSLELHRRPSQSSDFHFDHASDSIPTDHRPRQRRSAEGIQGIHVIKPADQTQRRISAPSPLPVSPSTTTSTSLSPTPVRRHRPSSNLSHSSSFPCALAVYGCPSTFASKNEWKRHVATQHLRLDLWRCDLCPSSPPTSSSSSRPAQERHLHIFNRKDLFVQHLRRMHPSSIHPDTQHSQSEETLIALAEKRCRKRLRHPPGRSMCPFCSAGFNSWDARMEHMGRHMETWSRLPVPRAHASLPSRVAAAAAAAGGGRGVEGGTTVLATRSPVDGRWESLPAVTQWEHDGGFHGWLMEERIIVFEGRGWRLADARR